MQVTIFGASGKVGQQVTMRALEKGYEVVAFVHSHNPFPLHHNLKIVKGDIRDRVAVAAALAGSTAAISTLGSWGTKEKDVVSRGMQAIIPAMEQIGIKRLVTVTGAGARWSSDHPGIVDRLGRAMLLVISPRILRDGEEHLQLLTASNLEWTSLRAPIMNADDASAYNLDHNAPPLWEQIPRATVAKAIVDELESFNFLRSAPYIHST